MENRSALITGGNRGLGLGVVQALAEKDYSVILTCRDEEQGKELAEKFRAEGRDVTFHALDVSDPSSIEKLKDNVGPVDVLINNAGILIDSKKEVRLEETKKLFMETLEVNVVGAYLMCLAFLPGMKERGYGRIVNVSSGAAQLQEGSYYKPLYGVSKTALNAITVQLANRYGDDPILINAVCPGWVRTDMGGPDATRSLEEGVFGIVWAATLPEQGPSGGFFRDGKELSW